MKIPYTTSNIKLSPEQLGNIPNLLFTFQGIDGTPFTILMPWTSYVDSVGGGKYAFRIYLSEGQGVVLGANFMTGYNVIFDQDAGKIGFAKSNCKYEDYSQHENHSPTAAPTIVGGNAGPYFDDDYQAKGGNQCIPELIPSDECSAQCPTQEHSEKVKRVYGNQTYIDSCGYDNPDAGVKACSITCQYGAISRGRLDCPDNPWTTCNAQCIQYRDMPLDPKYNPDKPCSYRRQTQSCYSGLCPYEEGDYIVYIDMRLGLDPSSWSYVYTEDLYGAFASIFHVKESSIELLNTASAADSLFDAKLHFQIRLKLKDYNSLSDLTEAAESIPIAVYDEDFSQLLIETLTKVSKQKSSSQPLDYSPYGWMEDYDVEVLNAVAMPIGEIRDPVEVPEDGIMIFSQKVLKHQVIYMLVGILLGCCSVSVA
jgi:hypothetical protein